MKTLGFFSRHQRDIELGKTVPVDEREQPQFNQIWRTTLLKETWAYYVRIKCVAYRGEEVIVVYNRCDQNGLFVSLRTGTGDDEIITKQPFFMPMSQFIFEFQKYKEL